jgi:hypothetical protein
MNIKNKKYLLFGIMIFCSSDAFCQFLKVERDSVSEFYCVNSFILDTTYNNWDFVIKNKKRRIPSLKEIVQSEEILRDYILSNKSNNIRYKDLIYYFRQYYSFFDQSGNIIVVLNLVNSKPKKQKDTIILKGIERELIGGMGGEYYRNILRFEVNLNNKTCEM